jgi:hypothetical protein
MRILENIKDYKYNKELKRYLEKEKARTMDHRDLIDFYRLKTDYFEDRRRHDPKERRYDSKKRAANTRYIEILMDLYKY